jgi:16S rRNA (cytosine1402-N4)-methyltransferase
MLVENKDYHIPVLLKPSVDELVQNVDGIYVDVTYGGGGHSTEILSRLSSEGSLVAFDQDLDAEANLSADSRLSFVRQNFTFYQNYLRSLDKLPVDGVLADLGVSSHQFDVADRGFSFRFDAGLDMRMNRDTDLTAFDIVMNYDEADLLRVFREYGELKNAYSVASRIAFRRKEEVIDTIEKLKLILESLAPRGKFNTFYAKVFQALRIEVNDEMGALREFLEKSAEVVKEGGRLVVITYHSLEDRMVKNFIKSGNIIGKLDKDFYGNINRPFREINRKPIVPSNEEVGLNNRARSAKMRIAERI